ncbi:hypothetical protein COCVIDRAFT_111196, partial [Bipolaris victoriae FI3]
WNVRKQHFRLKYVWTWRFGGRNRFMYIFFVVEQQTGAIFFSLCVCVCVLVIVIITTTT